MGAAWELTLLGALRAWEHATGRVVTRFRTRKTGSLLAYLACHPQPQERAFLAELLWPGVGATSARHRLRLALSALRAEGLPVEGNRTHLWLTHGSVLTDVQRFEQATPAEACALYNGSFLVGYDDDWVVAQQRRLEERFLGLLEQATALPRPRELLPLAEKAVRLLPDYPETHLAYLRLLLADNQYQVARRHYTNLRRRWRRQGRALPESLHRLWVAPSRAQALPVTVPLLGRERERRELERLFGQGARLVTITGPGGMGKTTLALELATTQRRWRALFVPLAEARTEDRVSALLLQNTGTQLESELFVWLAQTPTLLILDSAELAADAVAVVVRRLLSAVGDLVILVTSQVPLRLSLEHGFVLGPLAPSAALQLLCQRAGLTTTSAEQRQLLRQLVGHLEGWPLALELAAPPLATLGPKAVLSSLEMALWQSPMRDTPERLRSLPAVVQWAGRLLSPAARRCFTQLTVFPGSFDAEGVRAVCGSDRELASLIQASLLQRAPVTALAPRFRLLEPLRRAGHAQLPPEQRMVLEERLARHFARWASREPSELRTRLLPERENLRQALHWLTEHDPAAALALAAELAPFLSVLLPGTEHLECLDLLLRAVPETAATEKHLAWLHNARGLALRPMERFTEATHAFQEALRLAERQGSDSLAARAYYNLSLIAGDQGEFSHCVAWLDAAEPRFQALGEQKGQWAVLWQRGNIRFHAGDYQGALEMAEELLQQTRTEESLLAVGKALLALERAPEARSSLEAALELARQGPPAPGRLIPPLLYLVQLELRTGYLPRARTLLQELLRHQLASQETLRAWLPLLAVVEYGIAVGAAHEAASALGALESAVKPLRLDHYDRGLLSGWLEKVQAQLGVDQAQQQRRLGQRQELWVYLRGLCQRHNQNARFLRW